MHQPPMKVPAAEPRKLGKIELNGIRYAASFVVHKLKNKYQKVKGHEDVVYC